jgi:two-component system CheB/CheR fusion protein
MEQGEFRFVTGGDMKIDLDREPARSTATTECPVVGIGISIGGLEPLKTLLRMLPVNTGMAFVVLHHLRRSPTHLPEILRACTSMPVLLAQEDLPVRANNVYVLGSGLEMTLRDGAFRVKPAQKAQGWSDVITTFLLSLAVSKHPGIAVILSGLDEDGAAALQAFKRHGGITIVQELSTAEKPDMPHSAIRTGAVDHVVPPQAMARLLENISGHYKKAKGAGA